MKDLLVKDVAQNTEIDKLRMKLKLKQQQVVELEEEVADLKGTCDESEEKKAHPGLKGMLLSLEVELESICRNILIEGPSPCDDEETEEQLLARMHHTCIQISRSLNTKTLMSFNSRIQSPRNATCKSFASNFSTQTLELDLDMDISLADCKEEEENEMYSKEIVPQLIRQSSFEDTWKLALKSTLLVKCQGAAKYSPAFCLCANQMLYIFKNESEGYKVMLSLFQASRQVVNDDTPYIAINLENSETRVVRRPLAQEKDDDIHDARSSMMAWLKRRNLKQQDKYHNKRYFKVQVVERLASNDSKQSIWQSNRNSQKFHRNSQSFSSDDDGTLSVNSNETFVTSGGSSNPASGNGSAQVFIAFPNEVERSNWTDEFMKDCKYARVNSGSIWVKQKQKVKRAEDQWIKRYAVLRESRLDLYECNTNKIRETVSLTASKIEPAYSAHIFISHRSHQSQLVTLRAYDAAERNWWQSELRMVANNEDIDAISAA